MVEEWLIEAAREYNLDSLANRDSYAAVLLMPIETMETILDWTFSSLPDEILVGMDPNPAKSNPGETIEAYSGSAKKDNLFAGQGFVLGQPHFVNRGNSEEVHHVPEEWVDGIFAQERGVRGGRFTHWLHTHPNCPAIPSEADASASQSTDGVDLILGIEFSPQGPLPWFDDIEGERRVIGEKKSWFKRKDKRPVLGMATTGHQIHSLELIAFHKAGLGVNVVFVDEEGKPY